MWLSAAGWRSEFENFQILMKVEKKEREGLIYKDREKKKMRRKKKKDVFILSQNYVILVFENLIDVTR